MESFRKQITSKRTTKEQFSDDDYIDHTKAVCVIGSILLENEGKKFVVDDKNKKILKFLMLYFNGQKEALEVFPKKNYSLHKNIMLIGKPGAGKTLIMQVFSEYLRKTNNPLYFRNIGATELMNFQKMHGHINPFTYNINADNAFDGNPVHLCLNDVGYSAQEQKSYGTNMKVIFDEFMYARYEIWVNKGVMFHITSNLDGDEFKDKFDNRIVDRLKVFNVIVVGGESRR